MIKLGIPSPALTLPLLPKRDPPQEEWSIRILLRFTINLFRFRDLLSNNNLKDQSRFRDLLFNSLKDLFSNKVILNNKEGIRNNNLKDLFNNKEGIRNNRDLFNKVDFNLRNKDSMFRVSILLVNVKVIKDWRF